MENKLNLLSIGGGRIEVRLRKGQQGSKSGLAMETSKVESVVRNQAEANLRPAAVIFAKDGERTGFLLMNCHGMRQFRADAKILFSLCSGLAMETSKVESVVRNQAEANLRPAAVIFAKAGESDNDISSDVITINSCEEKRQGWNSDDEVSSDVSNHQRATVQPTVDSADALCDGNNQQVGTSRKVPVARYQSQGTSRKVPVAEYTSRSIPVTVDPVAGYRELQPVDKESSRKMMYRSQATVHPVADYSVFHIQSQEKQT
ncbi:hypothetical protein F511_37156 [Dorcoceras hygrometricum]|uniref:Uncharacterized protein n=1 Tax=Dorcoceras hygrometricum TaxID=472368 RepID=A0A2Z7DBY5_9LAMI|nr:hypothetical protein F511_37156 [Dorcoceras hygrometricum]